MGRVTVFSIDGCSHCLRAKQNLKARDTPFLEINLSSHPDKRSHMLSLADSLTVPQIFFNDRHIGGTTELIALLEEWDQGAGSGTGNAHDRIQKEYLSKDDPSDPRLEASTASPIREIPAPPRNQDDNILLPKSLTESVLEMTLRLTKAIPRYNLLYLGKTYKNAAKGKTFTDALLKEFALDSREEAVEFGKYLQQCKILDHVTGDHVFKDTRELYFRLQPFQSPGVINSFRIWTDRVDSDYMSLVSRLSKIMQGIHNRCTDVNGDVDLQAAEKDEQYATFEEEMCELQGVSMDDMGVHAKTAFLINVYNLLIKYAFIKYGFPESTVKRSYFFLSIVNIGGHQFSFNDLENGILRANAFAPYAYKKQFLSGDARVKYALKKVDNRIHFALNCGARSCPPVKKFSVNDLEEELRIVALSFCEDDLNVRIRPDKNEVRLSSIFKWYKIDFAQSTSGIPNALVKNLRGEKKEALQKMLNGKNDIKVKFNTYDWSSNVTNSKVFVASSLKSDEYSLKTIFGPC